MTPTTDISNASQEQADASAVPIRLGAPEACPRFVGRVVRQVPTGLQSPLWLRERLRRAGLRAIHPIVDVTNYVMLELGQPLHAYDLARLDGALGPRMARAGEELELLDGRSVTLTPDVLVIADEAGAVGLAGIMGGARTAVQPDTTDVLFEAAWFAPAAIGGRARRFGLHTDASLRFERGVDPTGQVRAIERATALLVSIAGGDAGPIAVAEEAQLLPEPPRVPLREAKLASLLGIELPSADVERLLAGLGMTLERTAEGWLATPPPYRFDIRIEEDLVEEVGRSYGYDHIPAVVGPGAGHLGTASEQHLDEERLLDLLVARGYTEVVTFGFVDQALDELVNPAGARATVANPIASDLGVMRTSLWPGLLRVARQNLSRQRARVKIVELGRQFTAYEDRVIEQPVLAGLVLGSTLPEHWSRPEQAVDFHDVKADIEALLRVTGRAEAFRFEAATHAALAPGRTARIVVEDGRGAGWLGVLHPRLQQALELRELPVLFSLDLAELTAAIVPAFHPVSKFPAVRRDLALLVPVQMEAATVVATVRRAAGDLLQDVVVFDVFTGTGIEAGRKSLALGLILQGVSRTLGDADVEGAVTAVTSALEREFGITTRS